MSEEQSEGNNGGEENCKEESVSATSIDSIVESVADSKEIVVFDSLDTIQGYEGAEPGKNKDYYLKKTAAAMGISVEEMLKLPTEQYLSVLANMMKTGELVTRSIPGAEDLILQYIGQGIRPVIITADIEAGARESSKPFVSKGLIRQSDVHAVLDIGSKADPATWVKAVERYQPGSRVVAVYEDTQKNLDAAIKAYKVDGYLAKETASGLTVMRQAYKG
jgi:hypothetical protein